MNYCTYFLFSTRQYFGEDDNILDRKGTMDAENRGPAAITAGCTPANHFGRLGARLALGGHGL
jgi:hypothetical protein